MRRFARVGLESSFGGGAASGDRIYGLDLIQSSLDSPNDPFIGQPSANLRSIRRLVPGTYIPEGSLEMVVDSFKMGVLFRSMFGHYAVHAEGTVAGAANSELADEASVGDTAISVDAVTGFSIDDYIQIGSDWADNVEVHQITSIDATNDTLTVVEPLLSYHSQDETVEEVASPWVHVFRPQGTGNNLPSLEASIAKDSIRGDQKFVGLTVNEMEISTDVGGLLVATFNCVGQKDSWTNVDSNPGDSADMNGFTFADCTEFKWHGKGSNSDLDLRPYARSFRGSVANGISSELGVRFGSRFPQEFQVGEFTATISATLIFRSADAYNRFWGNSDAASEAVPEEGEKLALAFYRGSPPSRVSLELFNSYVRAVSVPVSTNDVLVQEIEFVGSAGSSGNVACHLVYTNNSRHIYY